ncbi:phosphate signaling complex protein PhoU [bacterium]|nr:phosphate signaling complex protein PhoU [bacterium]
MSVHLQRDMDSIHRDLLSMCAQVEDMIHQAVDGLKKPSVETAERLKKLDDKIDDWDVRIENDCLKILALHQPVANDLRRICSVLKIIAELERVADLGVHIAERACGLMARPDVFVPEKLKEMANRAIDMLRRAIDSYVELDSKLARKLVAEDAQIDELNREIIRELTQRMQQSPDQVEPLMHLFSASRHVERVADHATNIAEDVVYMVEGEIIRHRNLE